MDEKLIVFIIDESTNTMILSNKFINVDVKYILINYNNKDKPFKKSSKHSNLTIQNENKDSLEIFLNTNNPKLIYFTVSKLINPVENYINSSNKDIYIYSNQSLQIKNKNCILNKSMKIDKFLSFAFEHLCIKIEKPREEKPKEKNQENILEKNPLTYNFYKFQEICLEILPNICDVTRKEIKTNGFFESVFIEFRTLPHCECIIKNCVEKLDNSWSHTIICNNDNYTYMESMCDRINKNIKIIKLDISKTTHNDYNNLLLTKEFWNMLTGEKILIYQSDSFIFKGNLFDFQEWDYIGAPFQINSIEGHNVGNGGLSLRSKSKMIEVLDKVDLSHNVYRDFVNNYKKKKELDNYPEDVVFSQNMQKLNIGKVADFETAKKFCIDSIYYEDSFGMHAMWYSCKDWKEKLYSKFKIKNKLPNDFELDKKLLNNHSLENIIDKKLNILFDLNNYNNSFIDCNEIKNSSNLINIIDYNIFDNNFILVIDFPNFGGGTQFFINSIISKYKKNQTFITARNFNKNIELSINNEYLFGIFDENFVIDFINNNKYKITKIFINHIFHHTATFIDFIMNLNIEKTTITHDYYLINNNAQPYYNQINLNYIPKIDFKKLDNLIVQNRENLNIYNNFLNENQKIVISPLPDFNKSLDIIYTNNDTIVIGIIGFISDIKGGKILNNIINYIKINNLNIEVIIFGKCNFAYKNQYIYNNIYQLNNLLKLYKPNLFFETSIWPETYSYTLTLEMLTDLPILSFNKKFKNVIKSRLNNYNKHYFYDNITDFFDLVYKFKQNYFYTIEPIIYFNSFWDNYFNNNNDNIDNSLIIEKEKKINLQNKNVVLVTSKIYVSDKKFSYVDKRSIYTPKQRFEQTIETIESIRINIPNSHIILFDNSIFDNNYKKILENNVDIFINITDDKNLNFYTNDYEYKAFSEISQQLSFYNTFFKNVDINSFKNFFKISGRYLINNTFNFNNFDNEHNIFKKNDNVLDRNYYYTCFYKLNSTILNEYFITLQNLIDNKNLYENSDQDLEVILPRLFIDRISLVENLGITQRISVWDKIEDL
jgi:hypothetical protein